MAQFARPSSDVALGGWSPIGGPTNLYECLDETAASDSDYIEAASGDTTAEVGLGSVTDPAQSTGHVLRVRGKSEGSGSPERITIELVQGTTVIATPWSSYNINRGAWEDLSYTLTAGEADSITNYADLRIRFTVDSIGGGSERLHVSWAELEVPDPISLDQIAFRGRYDTEPLNSSTFDFAENTNFTADTELNVQLHFEIEGTGTFTPQLRYEKNATGGYVVVPTEQGNLPASISAVGMNLSSQYADGAATSNLLTTSAMTFQAGEAAEDNTLASVTLAGEHVEIVFTFRIRRLFADGGQNDTGDTFDFRIYDGSSGNPLTTYTRTPRVTLNVPAGLLGGTRVEAQNDTMFADGGKVYSLQESDEPSAFVIVMARDASGNWAPVDKNNGPTTGAGPVNDIEGGDLDFDAATATAYILHQPDGVYEHIFRSQSHATNPDTWGTIKTLVAAATGALEQACCIVRRSNGNRIAFYAGAPSGADERLEFQINTGSGWTGTTGTVLDNTSSEDHFGAVAVMDEDDLCHIFYAADNGTTIAIHRKTLTSGGTLTTDANRETVISGLPNSTGDRVPCRKPRYYNDGGVRVVVFAYKNGSDVIETIHYRDGVAGTAVPASDSATQTNQGASRMPAAAIALDGTTVHLVYATPTTGIYRDSNNDEAGWGTDTQLLSGTFDDVTCLIFQRSGTTYLGYVYEEDVNGGTGGLKYAEVSFVTAHALTASQVGRGMASAAGLVLVSPSAAGMGLALADAALEQVHPLAADNGALSLADGVVSQVHPLGAAGVGRGLADGQDSYVIEAAAEGAGRGLADAQLTYIIEALGEMTAVALASGQAEYILLASATAVGRGLAGGFVTYVHEQQAEQAGMSVANGNGLVIVITAANALGNLRASGVVEETGVLELTAAMLGLSLGNGLLTYVNELAGNGLGRGLGASGLSIVHEQQASSASLLMANGDGLVIVLGSGSTNGRLFASGIAEQTGIIQAMASMTGLSLADGSLTLVNELLGNGLGWGRGSGQPINVISPAASSKSSLFADGAGFNIVVSAGAGIGRLWAHGLAEQSGVIEAVAAAMGWGLGSGQPTNIILPTASQTALFTSGGQLTQVHQVGASAASFVLADGQGNNIVMSQAELIGLLMTTAVILGDGAAEVLFKGMWRGMARAMR